MSDDTKKLAYAITLDTQELEDKSTRAVNLFRGMADGAEDSGNRIASSIGKMGAAFLSFSAATAFVKQIVKTRSEIESLEVSFQTLTGSMERGTALLDDIKTFAVNTPMMLGDLAKGAQTLLGFNIEAEKVMDILKQIGDISMGDSQKFQSLTLAFAQMSSTGKLMGQDLLQMINAGFNPLTVIAEKTGKSVAALKDEMAAGKISVDMVTDAFASATSEGGKFYQMLEKQSQTTKGALSNLQGAVDDALNELGQKTQGMVLSAVQMATDLVRNYETVGKVLGQLIIIYGSYKVALATAIALEKAKKALNFASEYISMARALGVATANQIAFNTAAMMNPYVWIAVAVAGIAGLVGSIALWKAGNDEATASVGRMEQAVMDERDEVNRLYHELTDANTTEDDRRKILEKLKKINPDIVRGLEDEADAVATVAKNLEEYNKQQAIRQALAKAQDNVNMKTSATGQAQSEAAGAKLELQNALETLIRDFDDIVIKRRRQSGFFTKLTDEERAEMKASVEAVMDDTTLTMEQKAARIKNILAETHQETYMNTVGQYQDRTVEDIKSRGDAFKDFVKAYNAAADAQRNYAGAVDEQTEAEQHLADMTNAANVALQNGTPTPAETAKVNNYAEVVKKLTGELKDMEKKLKDLRAGKGDLGKYNTVEDAIKAAEDELDAKKKEYKTVTGQEYGKVSPEAKARERAKEELKKALSEGELKIAEAEISAMKDGLTRKLAQIELDRRKTEAALDKELADLEKKAKEAGQKLDPSVYTGIQQRKNLNNQAAAQARTEAERQNTEAVARMYRDLGDVFAKEEQRKLNAITRTYEDMRKELKKSLDGGSITAQQYDELLKKTTEAEKHEINEFWSQSFANYEQCQQRLKEDWAVILNSVPAEYAAEANRQLQQALDQLNAEEFQRSAEYQKFFTANLTMSRDEVVKIAEKIKEQLNVQLRNGTITAEDFLNTWEKIEKQVREVEGATGDLMNYMNGGIEGLLSGRQRAGQQQQASAAADYQKYAEMFQKAQAANDEAAMSAAQNNMAAAEGAQEAGAAMSGAAAEAAGTIAIIDAIIHAANELVQELDETVHLLADLADSFGADTSAGTGWGGALQFFDTFAKSSQYALDGWESLKSGNPMGVINGIIGSITTWIESYNRYKDAKFSKAIEEDAKAIERLKDKYDDLADMVDKVYSKQKRQVLQEQNAYLEQQNRLIRDQIKNEQDKKKTDEDAIEEYQKQIKENNKLIAENKEAMIDAIFGDDIQSAIEDFSSAVADAWADNTKASDNARKVVKDMMKNMVTESIKAYIQASDSMARIRQYMLDAYADEVITDAERQRIEKMGEELADEVEKKYGWASKLFQDEKERKGVQGSGIAASQDSVNQLDARMTTVQGHTFSLVQGQQELMRTSASILEKVSGIEENTGRAEGHLDRMQTDIQKMKGVVDDIQLKGVKIRN